MGSAMTSLTAASCSVKDSRSAKFSRSAKIVSCGWSFLIGSVVNSDAASVLGHADSLGCPENSLASWAANTGSSGTSKISFSTGRGVVVEAAANSVTASESSSPVSCGATAGTASGACSSTGPTDSKNDSATGADSLRCGLTAASAGPTDSKNGSATGADSSRCGSTV